MGQVRLVSDTWGFIAAVEITEGHYADPGQNPVVFSGSVSLGQTFLSQVDVVQSYRRCNIPDDAKSGWTSWYTNSNTIDGVDDWSLR